MRKVIVSVVAILGIGFVSVQARADCNIQGQYCEQPNWASNIFSGTDRVPEATLPPNNVLPMEDGYQSPSGAMVYGSPVYVAPPDEDRPIRRNR